MFSNLKGSIDENEVMFSKDKKIISWCDDLFDYLWKKDSSLELVEIKVYGKEGLELIKKELGFDSIRYCNASNIWNGCNR